MRSLTIGLLIIVLGLLAACRTATVIHTDPTASPTDAYVQHNGDEHPDTSPEPTATPEIPSYNEYAATLDVDPQTRIIKGIERIRFTNRTGGPLDVIVCRLYLNAFSKTANYRPYFTEHESGIFRYGTDYGYMNILHVSRDNDEMRYQLSDSGTVLTITLDEPLQAAETFQLKIQFEAYVPKISHRTGANDIAMWCGAFLPVLSVYDTAEGWHTEPYYAAGDPFFLETANYTVDITTPEGYVVTGTGIKTETIMDGYTTTTLSSKMTRDFAFAISSAYKTAVRTTDSGKDIYLYYYSDNLQVDHILDLAAAGLEYFQNTIGEYPYAQIVIAETDMFVSGMEFSKIVFVRTSTLQRSQDFTTIIHELGHQWFFNVIGSNPISDAWLDEGMTLYIQEGFFYPDPVDLRDKLLTDYQNLRTRYNTITNEEGKKIASSLAVYDNWSDYYQIQYNKAKIMMFALNQLMGNDLFQQFIKQYYQMFCYKNVTRAEFIQLAETVYGESLIVFFNTWLYSTILPAFPEVHLS